MSPDLSPELFSRVVQRDEHRLRAYLTRRLPADAVEDVLADVLLVAWRRRAEMPVEPLPWLLTVASKTLSTRWRSEARRDALIARVAAQPIQDAPSVEAELDRRRQQCALAVALGELSETDRELLLLRFWDEMRPREIAGVLALPSATVRARLRRATVRLHRELRRALDQDEVCVRGRQPADGPKPLPIPSR